MIVSILNRSNPTTAIHKNNYGVWLKAATTLVFHFLIFCQAFGQAADLDQIRNGSASSPLTTAAWVNGNAGPSNAHYAEGYSIPYRMRISGLVGGVNAEHILIIEWDTKDQNGHAIDYITHYDNMDNPVGSHLANFGHGKETIDPRIGTTFTGAPSLFQIPVPSSAGAEKPGQPATSFSELTDAAHTNNPDATMMAIWGGTILSLTYLRQDNQDATTASTKTQLKIVFKSANGSTALLAWGGHIAAEYDWGTGRGASGVSGSPYHMRLISIDGKGGNQDRSLKADAVLVPPPPCTLTAAQSACEGSSGPLTYSYTGSTTGITNYSWTLTPGTTNAKIDGPTSGASLTSVNIVAASSDGFTPGSFTLQLTTTNLGGTTSCSSGGTIDPKATVNAGDDQTVCSNSPAVTLAGSFGGGATSASWVGGTGNFTPDRNTLNATYTPSEAEITAGTVTLTLTTDEPIGPCAAVSDAMVITISPRPGKPTAAVVTPLCTDATMTVEVTLPSGLSALATVTLTQMVGGVSPITKNASDAVSGKLTFVGLTFGKGYSITITDNKTTANPSGCTSQPEECGNFTGGHQTTVNNRNSAVTDQEIVLRQQPRTSVLAAPNPFNDRIRFTLKSDVSGRGSLELYNTLGQRVKTVFQGQVSAGQVQTIEYAVPGSQRSSLIYVFRVGNEQTSGKLIGLTQ